MLKCVCFLLLSATTAVAAPFGYYADSKAGCLSTEGTSVKMGRFIVSEGMSGCDVKSWQSRGNSWIAELSNCTALVDTATSQQWEDQNWPQVTVTEQADGRYLFKLTGEGEDEWTWTMHRCAGYLQ